MVKLAAGFTWILTAALIVFLSVMIPYFAFYGMDGTEEMRRNAAVGETIVYAALQHWTYAGDIFRNLFAGCDPVCRCDDAAFRDYSESDGNNLRIDGVSPCRSVCGISGQVQSTAKDMESQAERDPYELGFFQLPTDPSGWQILPELSGGAGNLLRYCYSCIVDRKAEIS